MVRKRKLTPIQLANLYLDVKLAETKKKRFKAKKSVKKHARPLRRRKHNLKFEPEIHEQLLKVRKNILYDAAEAGGVNVDDKPTKIGCVNRLECSKYGALYGAIGGALLGGSLGIISALTEKPKDKKENDLMNKLLRIFISGLKGTGLGAGVGGIGGFLRGSVK